MAELQPIDATPRMTPETAKRLVETIERARECGVCNYPCSPAIGVYVFTRGMVKEVTNEADAQITIDNLRQAIIDKAEKGNTTPNGPASRNPRP